MRRRARSDAPRSGADKLRLTVTGLIGVLVLLQVASVTFTWRRSHNAVMPGRSQTVARTRQGAADLQFLLKAHLFGGSAPPPQSAAPPINSVLKLVGTIAGTSSAAGMAIIGSSTNVVHLYAVRDTVAVGVVLGAVYPDRVILLRGRHRRCCGFRDSPPPGAIRVWPPCGPGSSS